MKSRIAVSVLSLSVAVLSLTLGGCSGGDINTESNISSGTVQSVEDSNSSSGESVPLAEPPVESTPSTPSSGGESSSGVSENPTRPSENNFPESFTGYLGETLHGADAAEQLNGTVKFDNFTYLRWATPFFDNTLRTPDLINWDTFEMPKYGDLFLQKQTDPKWFAVKPGDELENGLVVKSARCCFKKSKFFDGTEAVVQTQSEVVFENTLTLNGVLYCSPEEDMYIGNGELFFFADSTANSNIPVINRRNKAGEFSLGQYVFSDAAFVCDGIYYRVGDIETTTVELSGIIKRGEVSEVRVTLDNIKLVEDDTGSVLSGAYADIVSIEKINN